MLLFFRYLRIASVYFFFRMKNATIHFNQFVLQRYSVHFQILQFDTYFCVAFWSQRIIFIYRQTFYTLQEWQEEREQFVRDFQQPVLACK